METKYFVNNKEVKKEMEYIERNIFSIIDIKNIRYAIESINVNYNGMNPIRRTINLRKCVQYL